MNMHRTPVRLLYTSNLNCEENEVAPDPRQVPIKVQKLPKSVIGRTIGVSSKVPVSRIEFTHKSSLLSNHRTRNAHVISGNALP